jgi:polyhydroxybutyrate depolymerase
LASQSRALGPLALALLLGGGTCALVLWGWSDDSAAEAPVAPVGSAPLAPYVQIGEARSLKVAFRTRTYQLHRGTGAGAGAPLWIVLHGSGGNGEDIQSMHGGAFDRLADREGLFVAYPDGYEEHWNDCRPRADYAANLENVDDVGFLRALVEELHVALGIDLEQVTVVGLSNGGQMVLRLALEAPDLARTYAAFLANLPAPGNDDCPHSEQPARMLLISGTEDPINPAGGGLVTLAGNTSRGAVLSGEETAKSFARLAGHTALPLEQRWPDRSADDGTSIESFEWKSRGHESVTWIRVVGGGHSVPTTTRLKEWPALMQAYLLEVYGRQSREFDTAEIVWRFSSSPDKALL